MINVTKTFFPPLEEYQKQLQRIWSNEWLTNRGELVLELEEKLNAYIQSTNLENYHIISYLKKAKAAEIEKALTKYLTINMPLDPSLYGSFLEMLKKILEQFKDNWDEIYKQLEELREKLKKKVLVLKVQRLQQN